jgi:hypothetical protein
MVSLPYLYRITYSIDSLILVDSFVQPTPPMTDAGVGTSREAL